MFSFFKKKKVKEDQKAHNEIMSGNEYVVNPDDSVAEIAVKEYTFYKTAFQKSISINILLAIGLSLFVAVDVYKTVTHKETIETFFVTDQHNRIIPIKPVNEPYSDGEVIDWASKSIMDIYTLSSLDFRKHVMSDLQKYFTPDALKQYREAIASRLSQIAEKSESMTATPSGSPVIVNKGVLDNRYYWQIMLPIQVTRTVGEGQLSSEHYRVLMNIVRADPTRYPSGLVFTSIDESEPINSKSAR